MSFFIHLQLHLLLLLFLCLFPPSLATTLPAIVQRAGHLAFPHIAEKSVPFDLWLHSFAVLRGYSTTIPAECSDCQQQEVACVPKCLFECVATKYESTEPGALAHLTLAQAFRHGKFPGTTTNSHCVNQNQMTSLQHFKVAADFATVHVQQGQHKTHQWHPIYDEHRLSSRTQERHKFGANSVEKFRLLGKEEETTAVLLEQSEIARQLAATKYHGLHSHTMSQRKACEWYEQSVALARRAKSSPPSSSLVMMAQCFTEGTGGFPKNPEKGVAMLRECVGAMESKSKNKKSMEGETEQIDDKDDKDDNDDKDDKDDKDDRNQQARAQCASLLGTFYLWGMHGVEQSVDSAESLLKVAAEQGEAFASYGLGMMWFLGYRNNTNRNYKLAARYLEDSSSKGYLLSRSYLGGMYMSGVGRAVDYEKEPDGVDTRVEKDLKKAEIHFETLAMQGGRWGDPDTIMDAFLAGGSSGSVGGTIEESYSSSEVLVAFEMKAMLGYALAFTGSGWLWDTADLATRTNMMEMMAEAKENDDKGIGRTVEEEISINQFEHHETRAVEWWLSCAEHHKDGVARADSLLFVGGKYSEKNLHEKACEQYAAAVSASSSKSLGILGWHLLMGKPCLISTLENIVSSLVVAGDVKSDTGGGGSLAGIETAGNSVRQSKAAAMVLAAAAREETIPGMRLFWSGLSVVADGMAWFF